MKNSLQFPVTSLAALVALFIVVAALVGDINFLEVNLTFLSRIERSEFDEILTAFGLILVGLGIDHLRARRTAQREAAIAAQRLRVLHATMRTVQDIVNNTLANIQLFLLEAEATLAPESIALCESVIQETAAKLKALGDLEATPEKMMASGPGIDYQGSAGEQHLLSQGSPPLAREG